MKNQLLFALAGLFTIISCRQAESPDTGTREVRDYTIDQFMNNENVFGSSFSADQNKVMVTSNRSGIFNAYTVPVTGGDLTALTGSDSASIYGISYFPEDDRILFQMDNNGDEVWQLYVLDPGGKVTALTAQPGARAQFYEWADDRKSFFIGWSKRDPRFMDVYEVSTATLAPELRYEMASGDNFGGISPDKRTMAIARPINTSDDELYLYDFKQKQLRKISEKQASHKPSHFSPDNRYFYYLTDAEGEYNALVRYDLAGGERTTAAAEDWDIMYASLSKTGKYQVLGINADGKTVVRVTEAATGKAVAFPDFGQGDITGVNISDNEQQVAFYVGSSALPGDLYVYNFETGENRKLTNTLNPEIAPDDLVEAEVVRFPSFDGKDIPGIYYKPHQAGSQNKAGALVWVHGGPGGQSRQTYNPLIQYLVNHGYVVLAINNRGSSGYGKTFFHLDDQQHGEGDLRDCIAAKDWMATQPYIDSTQIGIIGGSYGGFMVMRAMTHAPEAFAVGVDIYGVTNWVRTLRSIPPWWESFKTALYQEMGDPGTADSVRLRGISPLFHADQVQHPVMVLQGGQDPRVLKVESDEMVEAMRANGVPVEYVQFEDEGHGFVKKENQIEADRKILEFLDKYLRKTGLKG